MAGSNIPDIASDPEKGILKVSFFMFLFWFSVWCVFVCVSCFNQDSVDAIQLQEKFRLDLDDEASIHFFQDLINESVSALFPQMVETIHRWAQYWRWSQREILFHKHLCK
jgi:phosphatidylinositol 3-kinase